VPSFEDTAFGQEPFGQWPWSKSVLFDLLPTIYKDSDPANDDVLFNWTESLRYSFDLQADRITRWLELRDPLKVRTAYNEVLTVQLGRVVTPEAPIEQSGVDGSIDTNRNFIAASARFTSADLGKHLILSNSGVPINNRTFTISNVINGQTVKCDPPLVTDAGPLTWELKGFAPLPDNVIAIEVLGGTVAPVAPNWILYDGFSEFTVYARQQFFPVDDQPKILSYKDGVKGIVLGDGRLQIETNLTQLDVGRPVSVFNSVLTGANGFTNNGKYQIFAVDPTATNTLTLHTPLTIPGEDANGGVVYTYVNGNTGVTVTHIAEAPLQSLAVEVSGTGIFVFLQTDTSGIPISTATAVASAVNAFPAAAAMVTATFTGTGLSPATITPPVPVPGARLLPDPGPLGWSVLQFPQLQLLSQVPPKGVVEQGSVDLQITTPSTINATTAKFSQADVGKLLVVRGSTLGNDGYYKIASVTNTNAATITGTFLANESNLAWQLRTQSAIGDLTQVQVHAPSLIDFLAQDFGITVDQRESEARQRSWVENVTQWINLKGIAKAYSIIGAISGFNVTASQLYRITQLLSLQLPNTNVYVVGEFVAGRYGFDGGLTADLGGTLHFKAASATFKITDVGVCIKIQNGATPANDATYTIDTVVSATEVTFAHYNTAATPDYGVGGTSLAPTLQWEICRIYTDLPPTRPLFDDVNPELMQTIVGAAHFQLDTYCWDTNFINNFQVNLTATTPTTTTGVPITFTVTASGVTLPGPIYTDMGVIGTVGKWLITDSAGNPFWIETLPVLVNPGPPPVYTFTTFSSVVPALGTATLTYLCEPQLSCDYCAASVVLVVIEEGSVASETGLAQEKILERVLARLENEVKPIHVSLIPIFRRTLQATFNIQVTITTDREIYALIIAPVQAYYDIILGDIIPADTYGIQVTITTP
jgi:hypothetical protein